MSGKFIDNDERMNEYDVIFSQLEQGKPSNKTAGKA